MRPIATRLSPDQRQLMGQYYARLSPVVTAGSFDAERLEHGKVLAEIGDWSVQAPPCASCHGSRGTGVGSVTPPLAGQTQAYLLAQLKRFRSGERKSDTLGLMNGIARRLSNNDLRAAAAYYGSLAIPGSERQAAGAAK
jgi:cytochrome c553